MAQAGRAGAVTIATNMAGRGTDIILGGNSDYMARLKVREVLLPRLVRPEEGHRPPVPLQREASTGFAATSTPAKAPSEARAVSRLYPCELSSDTDEALGAVSRELVNLWGDRSLSILELEDRISSAGEKAPSEDPGIMQLRDVMARIRADYDSVIATEQSQVRENGGLHLSLIHI